VLEAGSARIERVDYDAAQVACAARAAGLPAEHGDKLLMAA
jgi:hypothetical protein